MSIPIIENEDAPADSIYTVLETFWRARSREIRTIAPGIVVAYNAAAQTATIQPALDAIIHPKGASAPTTRRRAELVNVPSFSKHTCLLYTSPSPRD